MTDDPIISTEWADHEGITYADACTLAISYANRLQRPRPVQWVMNPVFYGMYRSMMARMTWETAYRAARKAGRRDSALQIVRNRLRNGRLGFQWLGEDD